MLIYNRLADLCSWIIRTCSEDFFVHYSCISRNEKERISRLVWERVPEFFESLNSDRISQSFCIHFFLQQELTEDFYKKLASLENELKEKNDYFAVLGLIQIIDESLEGILQKEIEKFQNDDFSVVLNSNRETSGVGLLPRCSCNWERKRRLSHYYNRLDNFLFNFLLLENNILGELIDEHIFLKPEFFTNFYNTKSLKIAATPLQKDHDLKIDFAVNNKVQFFTIGYKNEFSVEELNLIWNKILSAGNEDSDIIVFPEVLGKKGMVEAVQKKIREAGEDAKIPSMIILPSHWENFQNRVTVLDKHGNILFSQTKQNPFKASHDGSDWLEYIKPNNVINILHYEGIGRIAILICKDFLTTKYTEQLMRCFKLTLLIVPSFSTGSYDFKQSFDLCAHDDCNVVWINTCAAMQKGKEKNFNNIGYVRKRISRDEDESQQLFEMKTCPGAFNGKCDKSCMFFETINGV